jgi:hypothetical protein
VFSNAGQNLAEAIREAVMMRQPSTKEGRQAFQRIKELIAATADHIPAPRDVSITHSHMPQNLGAQPLHRSNRSPHHNPKCRQGPAPRPSNNDSTRGGSGEGGGGLGGILPMGEITKMTELTTTRAAAITPMARAMPIATGETQGIGPN